MYIGLCYTAWCHKYFERQEPYKIQSGTVVLVVLLLLVNYFLNAAFRAVIVAAFCRNGTVKSVQVVPSKRAIAYVIGKFKSHLQTLLNRKQCSVNFLGNHIQW